MKSLKTCFSMLILGILMFSAKAETQALQPDGWTDGSGGQISNLAELRWLSETPDAWDERWEITQNIDASETKTWNVGDHDGDVNTPDQAMGFVPIKTFTGNLDGKGYSIKGLYIKGSEISAGLFESLKLGATVANLRLVDINYLGLRAGGIAYSATGASIKNCYVDGKLSARSILGGILGTAHSTKIESCKSNTLLFEERAGSTGGIIGQLLRCSISSCIFTGGIIANTYAGGIAGRSLLDSTFLTANIASGFAQVISTSTSGTIMGIQDNSILSRCFYDIHTFGELNKAVGRGTQDGCTGLSFAEFKNANKLPDFPWRAVDNEHAWVSSPHGRPFLYWEKIAVSNDVIMNKSLTGYAVENGAALAEKGIRCYQVSTKEWKYISDETEGGAIHVMPSGLEDASEYYVQAYAKDSSGNVFTGDLFKYTHYISVQYRAGEHGSIAGRSEQKMGEPLTPVTATPNKSYHFVAWTNALGDTISKENPITLAQLDEDITLTATFKMNTYTVRFIYEDNGSVNYLGDSVQIVNYGANADMVIALPKPNYRLRHWKIEGASHIEYSENDTLHLEHVTSDVIATAIFEQKRYEIAFVSGNNGSLIGGTQDVIIGENSSPITATAQEGYHFVHWLNKEGSVVSEDNPLTVSDVQEPMFFKAVFGINSYTFATEINGDGVASCAKPSANHGEDVPFTISANSDFQIDSICVNEVNVTADVQVLSTYCYQDTTEDCDIIAANFTLLNVKQDAVLKAFFSARTGTAINTAESLHFDWYPNPANNSVWVQMDKPAHYTVFTLDGVQVLNGELLGVSKQRIDLSQLNSGMYIVSISTSEGKFQHKFIKR